MDAYRGQSSFVWREGREERDVQQHPNFGLTTQTNIRQSSLRQCSEERKRKILTVVPPISTTNDTSPFTPGLFPDSNEARNAAPRIEFVGPDELTRISAPICISSQAHTRRNSQSTNRDPARLLTAQQRPIITRHKHQSAPPNPARPPRARSSS